MSEAADEFAEFDTTPEEILAVLDAGEPVRFGWLRVTRSTISDVSTRENQAVTASDAD